jgi:hypothetical protein
MPTIKTRRSGVDIRDLLPKPRAAGSKTGRIKAAPAPARFKKIEQHTREELELAIETAVERFGSDFWLMLHGIDSYMERRRRLKIERNDNLMRSVLAAMPGRLGDY